MNCSGEIVELHEDCDLSVGDRVTIIPYLECCSCIACIIGKPNCCRNIKVLGVHTDGGMQEDSIPVSLIKINQLTFGFLSINLQVKAASIVGFQRKSVC
nr:alcohol dehydrogenase catalytic domain-containing protein [Peribacillus kribbensis]